MSVQQGSFAESFICHRSSTVDIPAPRFEGGTLEEGLLGLLKISSGRLPDVQVKLHGSKGFILGKIVPDRCRVDEATGHILVVVRRPGACVYNTDACLNLHFVRDDGQPIDTSSADIIESVIVGYPTTETTKEILNTHLGKGIRILPDGSRKEFDLPKKVVA